MPKTQSPFPFPSPSTSTSVSAALVAWKSPKYNKFHISFNSISFTMRNRIRNKQTKGSNPVGAHDKEASKEWGKAEK